MQITNYELGIVLPLYSKEEIEKVSCFERPPKKYGGKDRPWVSMIYSCMDSRTLNRDALCRCKKKALDYMHTDHVVCDIRMCDVFGRSRPVTCIFTFSQEGITAVPITNHIGELNRMSSHLDTYLRSG